MKNAAHLKMYKLLALLGVAATIRCFAHHGSERIILNTSEGLFDFTQVFEGQWQVRIDMKSVQGINNQEAIKILSTI